MTEIQVFQFSERILEEHCLMQIWLAAKSTSKDMGRVALDKSAAFSNG